MKKVIKNSGGQDFSPQVIFYMERNKELRIHDMRAPLPTSPRVLYIGRVSVYACVSLLRSAVYTSHNNLAHLSLIFSVNR